MKIRFSDDNQLGKGIGNSLSQQSDSMASLVGPFETYIKDEVTWETAAFIAGGCLARMSDVLDDINDARRTADIAGDAAENVGQEHHTIIQMNSKNWSKPCIKKP